MGARRHRSLITAVLGRELGGFDFSLSLRFVYNSNTGAHQRSLTQLFWLAETNS